MSGEIWAATYTLQVRETPLTLAATREGTPAYHLAFNISRMSLPQAKAWLTSRTALPRRAGQDELDFESWDAGAIYFRDPAGNIVELIACRVLPDVATGEFGPQDPRSVSKIGMPVDDVPVCAHRPQAALRA